MIKKNWFFVTLISSIIAFILSFVLIKNWKVSVIISTITALITISFNPVRRYMKICLASLSLLITTNTFSLKIALKLLSDNSIGEINTQLGAHSTTLSILLFLICVFFGVLDFFERNNKQFFKLFGKKRRSNPEKKIIQKRNKVGGDMAGGDINKNAK